MRNAPKFLLSKKMSSQKKVNSMAHVLIIDEKQDDCSLLHSLMLKKGYQSSIVKNLQEAMSFSLKQDIDVVLMDSIILQGQNSEHLQQLQASPSAPEVIIMSEKGCAEEAESAIRHGAWDYIVSSGSPQDIINPLSQVLRYRQKKGQAANPEKHVEIKAPGIIGNSVRLKVCLDSLMQAAHSDTNVLITGETGTGKELFSTALHQNSGRHNKNFVVVDCAALPETLVESTLFGHEKGSFTGANQKHYGLIKQADGGTLFLDEVGELPLAVQKTFLRVLEERRFRLVGGQSEVKSNFRLVAATNQNLEQMVERGTFREDLLFRLRTFSLQLPPLRDRLEDIVPLVKYFVANRKKDNQMFKKIISNDFLAALRQYHWPGNVRELFHAVERSLAAAQDHTTLYPYHLPIHIRIGIAKSLLPQAAEAQPQPPAVAAAAAPTAPQPAPAPAPPPPRVADQQEAPGEARTIHYTFNARQRLQRVREEVLAKTEEIYLKELLTVTERNISQAIQTSGLSRSRLYQLLKDYNILESIK